ncbi:MAG: hypothetical protein RL353_971 [Actinomycetota bacterium]|jgi:FlaA1/EpsC-like NDP-sugar epimerase
MVQFVELSTKGRISFMTKLLDGKRIVVTGGTGSLGKTLVKRLLSGEHGTPSAVVVFSRDEAKQHDMRMSYLQKRIATEEITYHNFERTLQFVIGDIRDFHSVAQVLVNADIVVNAAALKQVPSSEYFPYEAVQTNIIGAENIVRAITELRLPVETVLGISTDKACKPTTAMGMTKAVQERIFLSANLRYPLTRFIAVRYGNVLASRGSVVPLFIDQIRNGGPVTITDPRMTRFLLSLEKAVDTVIDALMHAKRGEILIPRVPAALITDLATALIGDQKIKQEVIGLRPAEKLHESLISEEEATRTEQRGEYFAVLSLLPEIAQTIPSKPALSGELSSENFVMTYDQTKELLRSNGLLNLDAQKSIAQEILR